MLSKTFFFSFITVGVIYALLAATTTLFYKNKQVAELTLKEIDILKGNASVQTRIEMFFLSLIATLFFPPAYITASVITLIVYLLTN